MNKEQKRLYARVYYARTRQRRRELAQKRRQDPILRAEEAEYFRIYHQKHRLKRLQYMRKRYKQLM